MTPLERYAQALRQEDADALHDVLSRHGMGLLDQKLPYTLMAAHWALLARKRVDKHRSEALNQSPLPETPPESPFEATARREGLRVLANALAELPLEQSLPLWWHFEDRTDAEILDLWKTNGLRGQPPRPAALRQRRSRTLEALRERLGAAHDE